MNRLVTDCSPLTQTNNMKEDVRREAEGEDLSHILARMAIRKAIRQHMNAKKFTNAVEEAMAANGSPLSQPPPPLPPLPNVKEEAEEEEERKTDGDDAAAAAAAAAAVAPKEAAL